MNEMSRKGTVKVTRKTHMKTDGIHAFYASGRAYMGTTGEKLIELVTPEALRWKTDDEGNRNLESFYAGGQLRISEDNGVHWSDYGGKYYFDPENTEGEHLGAPTCFLDEKNDILIRLQLAKKADREAYGSVNQGTYRVYYSVSKDRGATWSDPVQIVDKREGFDTERWGPGFKYGEVGGICGSCIWMDDGSVGVPFTVYERLVKNKPWYFLVVFARGYWKQDMSAMDWVFGERFEVPKDKSRIGCCEPSITNLGNDVLFMVTRCQGSEEKGFYSAKYCGVSTDRGTTWSAPELLKYEDGSTVWMPASCGRFYNSSKTGKTYLIANILDKPVFGQVPRYPLTIAEFDRENRCIVKESVQVIQDRPEGAHEKVRYTNFGMYEDRLTKNLIITLPEQYRYMGWDEMEKPEDFAADCIKYTVELS